MAPLRTDGKPVHLPAIYPITPSGPDSDALLRWCREILDAGASWVQFRRKGRPDRDQLRELDALMEIALPREARIVVDDRCDLCLLAGAAGVHLGQTDLPPSEARRILGPSAVIGFSTHSLPQARAAFSEPVDYIAIGPVFATDTKARPDPPVSPETQTKVLRESPLPVVAIGGIDPQKARLLRGRGFLSIAVIRALEAGPAAAWRQFIEAMGNSK